MWAGMWKIWCGSCIARRTATWSGRSMASFTSTRSTRSPHRTTPPGGTSSGRRVQTNLLKLMEETEVPARSPQDIAGQIQAMMDVTQRGKKPASVINTKHILFIVSGAFGGHGEAGAAAFAGSDDRFCGEEQGSRDRMRR